MCGNSVWLTAKRRLRFLRLEPSCLRFSEPMRIARKSRLSNQTVQRTGASRHARIPNQRQERLAPVADLYANILCIDEDPKHQRDPADPGNSEPRRLRCLWFYVWIIHRIKCSALRLLLGSAMCRDQRWAQRDAVQILRILSHGTLKPVGKR